MDSLKIELFLELQMFNLKVKSQIRLVSAKDPKYLEAHAKYQFYKFKS